MDYITNAIDNYLDNKEPYALQIDGEWGSGKTFFIKNYSEKTTKAKVIYFSVYGYNDLQNLKEDILSQVATRLDDLSIFKVGKQYTPILEQFSSKGKSLLRSLSVLSDIILEEYKKNILEKVTETILIVVDDLERLSKRIYLQDFLGFIENEIIEKLKFKVLIISNESRMRNYQAFSKIKEKIIGKTIEFSRDENLLKEILQEIVTSDFLIGNLEWIIDIFSIFDNVCKINLRTVFSIIYNFEFIERQFMEQPSEYDEQYRNEYLKSVFLNVYVITNELKTGNIKSEQIQILEQHEYDRIFYIFGKPDNKNYWHVLINKYHNKNRLFDDYIIYSNSIMSYVISGIWSDDNYRSKWHEYFYPVGNIENYEKLNNFYDYSEIELLNIQKRLLRDCYESNITYNKVIDIYRRFSYLQSIDLLLIEKDKVDKLILRIAQLLSDEDVSIEVLQHLKEDVIYDDFLFDAVYLNEIKKVIEDRLQSSYSNRMLDLLDAIFQEDYKKEKSIIERIPSQEIKIFKSILSNDLIPIKIVTLHNKAYNLATFINRQYLRLSNSYEFHQDEIEDVKKIIAEINNLNSNIKLDRVDSFKIDYLLQKLDELLEHWQK